MCRQEWALTFQKKNRDLGISKIGDLWYLWGKFPPEFSTILARRPNSKELFVSSRSSRRDEPWRRLDVLRGYVANQEMELTMINHETNGYIYIMYNIFIYNDIYIYYGMN